MPHVQIQLIWDGLHSLPYIRWTKGQYEQLDGDLLSQTTHLQAIRPDCQRLTNMTIELNE